MPAKRVLKIAGASVLVIIGLCIGLYTLVMWEGSSAREDAPALEASVAQWLLHYTVPADVRAMKNPLDVRSGSADVEAGHAVYTQKCEICHAYDGGGKTEIGSGEYPRPPDLHSTAVQRMSDGELYYHLKNGIRHTGMPGWTLPDRDRWRKTRMANVVRDPKAHPEAIIPDLSKPDPLLTFAKDDIALVYGSRWKQRYFKQVGNEYFALPA